MYVHPRIHQCQCVLNTVGKGDRWGQGTATLGPSLLSCVSLFVYSFPLRFWRDLMRSRFLEIITEDKNAERQIKK